MLNRQEMRSRLEILEQAAQQILQQDSAFHEAVRLLQREIDNDPLVQSAVYRLQAAGRRVLRAFVPHIRIRIKTEEGVFTLPGPGAGPQVPADEPVVRLTRELKNAAGAVITRSRCRRDLELIVNRAMAASDSFEDIASELQSAGHEVLISLDLSTYAQLDEAPATLFDALETHQPDVIDEPLKNLLSDYDLIFLKELKINAV